MALQYNFNYIDVIFAPGCPCAATFHSVGGAPAIGAGLEWRVANHWSLRGEYLYLTFSSLTGDSRIINPLGPQNAFFHHTMTLQESIARGAISYHF
jgi:hypothetical protein